MADSAPRAAGAPPCSRRARPAHEALLVTSGVANLEPSEAYANAVARADLKLPLEGAGATLDVARRLIGSKLRAP
jgi:hypothetical protein